MMLFAGAIALAFGGYGLALLGLVGLQRRLMFFPTAPLTPTPAELGIDYETVSIPVAGAQLHGWWLPSAQLGPTLLYLHGNSENISANLTRAAGMRERLGVSVLLADYRGYGASAGPFPSEQRLYADARAMAAFLQQRGIPPEQIVIYGHSIGGAIAIDLATTLPTALGLVVESSFTSMAAMARFAGYGRWVPVNWVLHQRFNSVGKLPSLTLPLLLIHGTADTAVPATMSEDLYAVASPPKQLWLIPEGDHADLVTVGGDAYFQRLADFLATARAPQA